ncbi:MAG: PocR ligand-binding domain-containing protein [Clostridia bacterium]|nr:PocR ligand-binding domain-containing protein [Clostridia bacterium]
MEDYNLQKMQELLRHFYNLTNIKICIYDNAENELCFYPEKFSPFCALLRTDSEMNERCKLCDKNAFSQCKKTREQYLYTCHAGLLECVSPILFKDKIIGYIVVGQIKTPNNCDFSVIKKNLPKDLSKKLIKLFDQLPSINTDKIDSAIKILDACAGYEYLKNWINSNENKIDILLDEYINKHITADLSVSTLCSAFHLSHSEIYSVFKEYFCTTPAEYVKMRRLKTACSLLKQTHLPVNVIAQKCGIPDYNYFSKIFKRTFKVSPREFRKG